MTLGKFQILVPSARLSGVVTWWSGVDFDLCLDPVFAPLMALFPSFETLHCERYGHSGLPAEEDAPPPDLFVGDHIAVTGALVADDVVHAEEAKAHPDRVRWRGLLKAWRVKPELHPYLPSTIELDPAPIALEARWIRFAGQVYSYTWLLNRLIGIGSEDVEDSWVSEMVNVGRP